MWNWREKPPARLFLFEERKREKEEEGKKEFRWEHGRGEKEGIIDHEDNAEGYFDKMQMVSSIRNNNFLLSYIL